MDARLQENLNNVQQDYIAPFLWLHNEDDGLIINELERIYECGIRSVCLESRTHQEFCREDWWSDVRLIFDECKKRGMRVWILDDKHFPSGYANGIFEEKYKHLRPFGITEWHVDVPGPVKDGSVVVDRHLLLPEDEIVAVAALKHIPDSDRYSQLVDITDGLGEGMVYFDLPEGMWRIVMLIKTRRGRAEPHLSFCDMLNPQCIDLYIDEVYQPHYDRFAEYFGDTFLGFFSDEPSFLSNTAQSFSPDIGEMYAHYPWNDVLKTGVVETPAQYAALWFGIDNLSDKVRYSYMDTITRMYSSNFGTKLGDWCRAHGIMYIGHVIEDNHIHAKTGSGTGHYFRALDGQDMSGIDVVLHQIVPGLTQCSNAGCVSYRHMNNEFFHYYLGKLGSSLAHIDAKKQGRAMCEIFGAYGWAEGTKTMKYLMDHMLVRGINYYVPHAFSPKPNDTDCPPNFYDSGNNPQYRFFKNNMDYLNRMCHMLSGGAHVCNIAILYDAENHWTNNGFLPLEKIAKELYDNLYDYDIIPADYLDRFNNGCINGEKYSLLIVPYTSSMPADVMEKIKHVGIETIIVHQDDCKQYILPCTHIHLDRLINYVAGKELYDVRSDYDGIFLRHYHYTRNNAHIYMFSNEDINHPINTKVTLSAFGGGRYIEYDAFENKAFAKNSKGEIELSILPYHSVLIICGDVEYDGIPTYVSKEYTNTTEINPVFDISISQRNSNEFRFYKTTDKLFNITGRGELPRFSGHIKYEAEISLKKQDCIIDLGIVGEVAELYLNGSYIATRQIPPYTFEVSKDCICDTNKLTVVVSNHNGYAVRDGFSSFMLFEPSGLAGPVTVSY